MNLFLTGDLRKNWADTEAAPWGSAPLHHIQQREKASKNVNTEQLLRGWIKNQAEDLRNYTRQEKVQTQS